jgi:hypothetical protein
MRGPSEKFTSGGRKREATPFRQGLMLGLASPLVYLGAMKPVEFERRDNVSRAWRNVGDTFRSVIEREIAPNRDTKR